ncbi:DNA (cytosine-5-)-methyltransferase [Phocaeicola faecalis]|uniref:DNA (cytosine-5-)-methyltransferase n=1 Tax=Phocaeicola faecalis TaxID=2786956 RepID=UPI001F01DCC7|nr:DNA (cytosine-5-)-methyltransferase [Phocaeicola faecalis]
MNIIELFAGVGGFRVGFDRVNANHPNEAPFFSTIWSNQFEPATKTQHASRTYCRVFGEEGHFNCDVALVDSNDIPVHDILVGGFPCQDYSVARVLSQAAGIEGKKGVLWWQIVRIVKEKGDNAPQVLFLENVDRLLGSPAKQRGRDFAIILDSLNELGYTVEWRIINAADYGMPQRRRRTYILAYKNGSRIAEQVVDPTEWIFADGVFAHAFPIADYSELMPLSAIPLKNNPNWDMADLSAGFNKAGKNSPFQTAGLMKDGLFYTYKVTPNYHGHYTTLGEILATGKDRDLITEDFYIKESDLPKWEYLKGAKHETRKTKDGFEFSYNEGGMVFPDPLDKASRTIITSEGGATASRFKHVIKDPENGRLRRLIPLELERLDMFPDNHTIGETDTKRAFFMGNALVCGIVTAVGEELKNRLG